MDEIIKSPVCYEHSTFIKIVMPVIPFFVLGMCFIAAGKDLALSSAIVSAIPFAFASVFIALYFCRTKIVVYEDRIVFHGVFKKSELKIKDVRRVEIYETGRGSWIEFVSSGDKRYKAQGMIPDYDKLLKFASDIKGAEVIEYGTFGRKKIK